MSTRPRKNWSMPWFYDRWIIISVAALLVLGLLMVASASMVISDRQYGYPFHYLIRQSVYLFLGLFSIWLVVHIPMAVWQRFSRPLFLVSLVLLVVVLVPGIGKMVNGARRWISFSGMSLQVSELLKFSATLYLASYLARHPHKIRQGLKGFFPPIALLGLMSGLLLLEPDFGAVTVITMTFLMLLFIAGARLWPFCVLLVLFAGALVLLAILSPYRLERLTTFLHPWQTQFGSGYQLTQSLIAFGRGGLFGVGLGNSVQKLFYLPEAHTDFLFAVLGEELGLVGAFVLIALFVLLVSRIFIIGRRAQLCHDEFCAYLAYGIALWLGLQVLINMGVNVGLLPTKGLTLPFISYGGSSMLVNCIVIGVVLRMSYEVRSGDGYAPWSKTPTHYQWRVGG